MAKFRASKGYWDEVQTYTHYLNQTAYTSGLTVPKAGLLGATDSLKWQDRRSNGNWNYFGSEYHLPMLSRGWGWTIGSWLGIEVSADPSLAIPRTLTKIDYNGFTRHLDEAQLVHLPIGDSGYVPGHVLDASGQLRGEAALEITPIAPEMASEVLLLGLRQAVKHWKGQE